MIKTLLPLIFSEKFFQKILAIILLIILFITFKGFLGLFLITFIFAYLALEVSEFLHTWIAEKSKTSNENIWKKLKKIFTINTIVTILYIFFVLMLVWLVMSIFPKIAHEIEVFARQAPRLANQLENFLIDFERSTGLDLGAKNMINDMLAKFNIEATSRILIENIKNTSGILLQFGLGLIMSYIFIIDRNSVKLFFSRMKRGNFAFIYREFHYFAEKIVFGFGRVFKAQGLIAFVNAILTTLGLLIIGEFFPAGHFPYIFTLSIIVFIFGFIPVFGTFLSGLPIIIIGYGIGGLPIVIAIIVMISLIHAIEAYILNPKIVSSYMHFPVFVSFATLIIAEHMMGMIGLLIGVPILAILIAVFRDLDAYITDIRTQYSHKKKLQICEIEEK